MHSGVAVPPVTAAATAAQPVKTAAPTRTVAAVALICSPCSSQKRWAPAASRSRLVAGGLPLPPGVRLGVIPRVGRLARRNRPPADAATRPSDHGTAIRGAAPTTTMWPAQVLAPYADRPSRPQPDESAPACHLAHGRYRRRAFARTAADLLSRHAADAVERRSVGGIGQALAAASRSRACIAEQAAAGPRRYGFAIMWLRRRLAARAGVRSIRCDDLGHTCATLPRWATRTSRTRPMTTDPVAVAAAVSRRRGDRHASTSGYMPWWWMVGRGPSNPNRFVFVTGEVLPVRPVGSR